MAIDHPNHGSRIEMANKKLQAFVNISADPKRRMAMLGSYVQSSIDQIALASAVRRSINGALDGYRPQLPELPYADTDKIFYHALSHGSMVGFASAAVSDDAMGAFFLSGAGGLMHITATSVFWSNSKLGYPLDATGSDVMFQIAMAQHYVDIADGLNFGQYFRNPPPGHLPKPVVMQYSVDDGNVINDLHEATAAVIDLPLMTPVYRATPLLRHGSDGIDHYENGYGVYQQPYIVPTAEQSMVKAQQAQAELEALAAQYGKSVSFSIVKIQNALSYNNYYRFATHLLPAEPSSVLKYRQWTCEMLQQSMELCSRGLPDVTETP
jgi:hypothetical protein